MTQENMALCKLRGMLVRMEVSKGTSESRCPECGAKEFTRSAGWISCECGFAISEGSYDRVLSE